MRALLELGNLHFRHGATTLGSIAHRRLARVYEGHGELRKAISLYKQLLARDPDQPAVLERLAAVYERLGHVGDAVEPLEALARLWRARLDAADPRLLAVQRRLAQIHVRRGESARAVPHLEAALRAQPDDAALRTGLVDALLRTNRVEEAELVRRTGLRPVPAPRTDAAPPRLEIVAEPERASEPVPLVERRTPAGAAGPANGVGSSAAAVGPRPVRPSNGVPAVEAPSPRVERGLPAAERSDAAVGIGSVDWGPEAETVEVTADVIAPGDAVLVPPPLPPGAAEVPEGRVRTEQVRDRAGRPAAEAVTDPGPVEAPAEIPEPRRVDSPGGRRGVFAALLASVSDELEAVERGAVRFDSAIAVDPRPAVAHPSAPAPARPTRPLGPPPLPSASPPGPPPLRPTLDARGRGGPPTPTDPEPEAVAPRPASKPVAPAVGMEGDADHELLMEAPIEVSEGSVAPLELPVSDAPEQRAPVPAASSAPAAPVAAPAAVEPVSGSEPRATRPTPARPSLAPPAPAPPRGDGPRSRRVLEPAAPMEALASRPAPAPSPVSRGSETAPADGAAAPIVDRPAAAPTLDRPAAAPTVDRPAAGPTVEQGSAPVRAEPEPPTPVAPRTEPAPPAARPSPSPAARAVPSANEAPTRPTGAPATAEGEPTPPPADARTAGSGAIEAWIIEVPESEAVLAESPSLRPVAAEAPPSTPEPLPAAAPEAAAGASAASTPATGRRHPPPPPESSAELLLPGITESTPADSLVVASISLSQVASAQSVRRPPPIGGDERVTEPPPSPEREEAVARRPPAVLERIRNRNAERAALSPFRMPTPIVLAVAADAVPSTTDDRAAAPLADVSDAAVERAALEFGSIDSSTASAMALHPDPLADPLTTAAAQFHEGVLRKARGELPQAISALREAARARAYTAPAALMLGHCLLESGDSTAAIGAFVTALAGMPVARSEEALEALMAAARATAGIPAPEADDADEGAWPDEADTDVAS